METPPKEGLFSPEEINRIIPFLEEVVSDLQGGAVEGREVEELLQDMEAYYGDEVGTPVNPELQSYLEMQERRQAIRIRIDVDMTKLRSVGGQLKSMDEGLVDFPHLRGSRVVLLCWKRGEGRVAFWHSPEEGFGGRRPL